MIEPPLTLRPTVIGGDRLGDDYGVYSDGRRIGRIALPRSDPAVVQLGTGTSTRLFRFPPGETTPSPIWNAPRRPSAKRGRGFTSL
jgi:hypothetical protein